jgi:predicted DNA-binding transcriptional regulator YafY
VLVEFTAGGLREMCWHLFTWGGEVEIVRPKRLVAMMREEPPATASTFEGASSFRKGAHGPDSDAALIYL